MGKWECECGAPEDHLVRKLRLRLQSLGFNVLTPRPCNERYEFSAQRDDVMPEQLQRMITSITGVNFKWAVTNHVFGEFTVHFKVVL